MQLFRQISGDGPPLLIIHGGEDVAWEERDPGTANAAACGVKAAADERRKERDASGLEPAHEVFFAAGEGVEGQPVRSDGQRTAVALRPIVEQIVREDVSLFGQDGHGRQENTPFPWVARTGASPDNFAEKTIGKPPEVYARTERKSPARDLFQAIPG